jgi:hypothetical protein
MTDTLAGLQRQRRELERQAVELDRKLKAARDAQQLVYADRLRDMELALADWAQTEGIKVNRRDRKNAQITTVGDPEFNAQVITITFAYPAADYQEGLSVVTTSDIRVSFEGNLPSVKSFMGLVKGIFEEDISG